MGLFYVVSFFLLFGALVRHQWQKPFLYLSFVVLFILSAFRGAMVGTDTPSYERIFNTIELGGTVSQEIGWQLLNKLIVYFDGDFQHLLMVSTLLIIIPVFYVAKRYSLNPMLSIFLFFVLYIYLQSFNITRQSVAISVVFLSYIFLIERRHIWFCLLVVLAATFHTTALICLPLVFINRIPDRAAVHLFIVFVSFVIGIVFSGYFIGQVADLLGYDRYLDNFESNTTIGLYLLMLNGFFVFVLFTAKERGEIFKLFFIYILLANLTAKAPYGYRLIFYFSIVQLLFLPYFISNNRLKSRSLAFFLVVIYSYTIFLRSSGSGGIVPYDNLLF